MNCSIAQSLEVVGEWWTLLVIREAMFFGACRFVEFQLGTGIADNILTERLRKLVARGVFERIPASEKARRADYRLTEMGRALFPVLTTLMQWGDRWTGGRRGAPTKILEKASRTEVAEVKVENNQGVALTLDDVVLVTGPGATAETRERLNPNLSRRMKPGGRNREVRARRRQLAAEREMMEEGTRLGDRTRRG